MTKAADEAPPAVAQVELAIFSELFRSEISVTDIQSGRADVYGQGQG